MEEKKTEEDGSRVGNSEQLEFVCSLLGLDPVVMERSLTWKNIGAKSVVMVAYNTAAATQVGRPHIVWFQPDVDLLALDEAY